jgi:hypothetical protein
MKSPPVARPQPPRRLEFAHVAVIVIGVTVLVMGRLCFNRFLGWDDQGFVHHNPSLNPPTLDTLRLCWFHPVARVYIPLTYTLWAGLALIARVSPDADGITLDPFIFHAANLVLHVLATLVVCKILLLIWPDPFAAVCGALVFAIHPIQVEAVAWVSDLKDVLSGLLVLLSLWQYLRFARDSSSGRRPMAPLALSVFCLILAMLAKSSAATAALAAIALDRYIVRRTWRGIVPPATWLMLAGLPFIIIAGAAQGASDLAPVPLWARPLIVGDSLAFYMRKLLWPTALCIDYGRTPWYVMRHSWMYFEWLAPAAIAMTLIVWRNRLDPLIAAALVFLAGCSPALGLMSFTTQFFSTTADHYLYWAMLGPAIAVAWFLHTFPGAAGLRFTAATLISALAILTVRQGAFWKDDLSLFNHALAINPKSFTAYKILGDDYDRQGNLPLAVAMLRDATAARHDFFPAYSDLGFALRQMGRLDESTRALQKSVDLQRTQPPHLRGTWVKDQNQLAQNLLEAGKPDQAAAALNESLQAQPDQPDVIALLKSALDHKNAPATTHPAATR